MDDLLNLFSLLSDKTRLRILMLLIGNELCVCEIFAALDMSQPRVSRQLAILKQAKLIKDRREGKWIYYRLAQNEGTEHLLQIISFLPDWLKNDPEFKNDREMLKGISELKSSFSGCKSITAGGASIGE